MPWKDPEKKKEYDREYFKNWYLKNGRKRAANYLEYGKKWRKENPEKESAASKVRYALRIGKLKKPAGCEKCQRVTRLAGHHEDYSKPLDVVWVCGSCHKSIHTASRSSLTFP